MGLCSRKVDLDRFGLCNIRHSTSSWVCCVGGLREDVEMDPYYNPIIPSENYTYIEDCKKWNWGEWAGAILCGI